MSKVTLTIGPKSYTVACADGEEPQITALGAMIAEKYAQLGSARAPLEAQNLLFAGLFLADELAEARKRLAEPPPPPPVDPAEHEELRAHAARLAADLVAAQEAEAAAAQEAASAREVAAAAEQAAAAARAEAAAAAAAPPPPPPAPVAILGAIPQGDLFGGPDLSAALVARLEALATRAEASAAALEAAAANA